MAPRWKALMLLPVFALSTDFAQGASVVLVTSPSWGMVTRPSSGTTSYSLSSSTGLVTVAGGSGLSLGGSNAGIYLASGNAFQQVSYNVGIGAFSGSGINATSAFINGTSSSGSGTLSILGTLNLRVGGVIAVSSGASTGIHSATVTLTVNFL